LSSQQEAGHRRPSCRHCSPCTNASRSPRRSALTRSMQWISGLMDWPQLLENETGERPRGCPPWSCTTSVVCGNGDSAPPIRGSLLPLIARCLIPVASPQQARTAPGAVRLGDHSAELPTHDQVPAGDTPREPCQTVSPPGNGGLKVVGTEAGQPLSEARDHCEDQAALAHSATARPVASGTGLDRLRSPERGSRPTGSHLPD